MIRTYYNIHPEGKHIIICTWKVRPGLSFYLHEPSGLFVETLSMATIYDSREEAVHIYPQVIELYPPEQGYDVFIIPVDIEIRLPNSNKRPQTNTSGMTHEDHAAIH